MPMCVTDAGTTIPSTAEQQLKAKSPMVTSPSGSDTAVIWLQKPKAIMPRCRTYEGTTTAPAAPLGTTQSVALSLL